MTEQLAEVYFIAFNNKLPVGRIEHELKDCAKFEWGEQTEVIYNDQVVIVMNEVVERVFYNKTVMLHNALIDEIDS